MKKLVFAILFCVSFSASAQTYIKTNALYWLGLLPNVQVETNLGAGFTFQGEVNASLCALQNRGRFCLSIDLQQANAKTELMRRNYH